MKANCPVVYFNNCHNRDHVALFGHGAFFDLGTTGRQAAQARDLEPGQTCVVAEWTSDERILFDWYSFSHESLLKNELGNPDRVFFGRIFASETMTKLAAAVSNRYSALFSTVGHFKKGSVFRRGILEKYVPTQSDGKHSTEFTTTRATTGAGFGDPAENKLIEMAAVRKVVEHYEEDGWSVISVERDKCGYDLECRKNGVLEHVEVKGVRHAGLCFSITVNEVEQARSNPKFVLSVVTSALTASATLTQFRGAEFLQKFELSTIQYRATLKP